MAVQNILAKPKSGIIPRSHDNFGHPHAPINDPRKDFKVQGHKGNVEGQTGLHHDVADLLTNQSPY